MRNCTLTKTENHLNEIYEDMLRAAGVFFKCSADMVYGEGDPDADLMLIGEAPGAEETRLSRPFVGQAGKNLDEFLAVLGIERNRIYITNIVKFRPFKTGPTGRLSNRPPKSAEISCMLPHLLREIEAVAPKVVVTLGNIPLKSLYSRKAVIGDCHAAPVNATALSHSYTLFPLYHPASIIYNHSLKDVYEQDLVCLKQFLSSI